MKKFRQILSLSLVIAMLSGMMVFPVSAEETVTPIPDPGYVAHTYAWYEDGAETGSYTISTPEELAQFGAIVDGTDEAYAQDSFSGKTVTLGCDIDLSTVCGAELGTWNPIGYAAYGEYKTDLIDWYSGGAQMIKSVTVDSVPFAGTFDGAGFEISNLYISSSAQAQGLFGYSTGTIRNLTVSGSIVKAGSDYVGGIVGFNRGTVSDVISKVSIDVSAYNVGGIAGYNDGYNDGQGATALIIRCGNDADVKGMRIVGGIVGENAGTVKYGYNKGAINAYEDAKAGNGGIAGRAGNNDTAVTTSIIEGCYNAGSVSTAVKWTGGIAGFLNANSTISNCVAFEFASRASNRHNPIAGNCEGTVTNSYSLNTLASSGTAYGEVGTRKSEAELKDASILPALGGMYVTDTANLNNGYPVLFWENDLGLYNISIDETIVNGTVSASAQAAETVTVTLTVVPAEDYVLDALTVTDTKGNELAVTDNAFIMPASDVTVTAAFSKIPVTYAWYEAGAETGEYTISTAEELAQFAAIVNGTDENCDQETFLGKTVTLAGDIDLAAVCSEELGSWTAIGGAAENVLLSITSQEELDAALNEHNIIYDDTGWSYKYGTDKNLSYNANRTYYYVDGQIFSGTFDGAGYTIDNLYVLSETGYAGLFGNVDGTLKNLTVTGSVTTATGSTEVDFVGGVTGKLSEGGRIERVTSYVNVDASAKAYNVGGIAGFNGTKNATDENAFSSANNTYIIECVNYGSVYGWSQVGGITGENAGQILRCANYGKVDGLKSGSKAGIGGITGRNGCNNTAHTAGTIIDCYNFGAIATSDNKWVGGIAGFNNAASLVRNCYNVGTVLGAGQANAICGQNEGINACGVYNCWYLDSTKVFDDSGVYGGTYADCGPKTEDEMKAPVFAAVLGESFNVDSENVNQGYPVLDWQGGSEAPALYTVTMPESAELFTVSYTDSTTVAEGGSFAFRIYVTEGYKINSVMANDTELTAVKGVYTIENITSDVIVAISVSCVDCDTATGWSGDLSWVLDNGTLTFSGEGKLRAYTYKSETPWYEYRESVTSVVLPEGVTRISGYAFYGMTNLVSINIPSTVTVIGDYAFKNCASLTEIVLPESLTTIGDSAFYGTGLTAVEIPASVCVINEYAFKGCASLTTVTLNEGLTAIGEAAFYACPALTEVVLPSTVTEIGGYAFKNCSALAAVTLNEGLETIGASAFYGCSALTEIVIPASVTSIEEYAFAHCTALAAIDIQGEPVIGDNAFKNVPGYNG